MTTETKQPDRQKMQETAELLRGMFTGAYVSGMIALGLELGLYRALAGAGAVTSEELAERTGLRERWLREWLRGQAAAHVLEYDGHGRFELTPEGAAFLADEDSLLYLGSNFSGLRQRLAALERLPESFRSGLGHTWDDRGPEHAAGTELLFRNWYRLVLVEQALPALAGVVEKLQAGGAVADVGCGSGIALVEMARAFPRSRFHGYDISRHALERAARNAAEHGVMNVAWHRADVDPLPGDASFDLITTFDCLHDMTHPEVAAAAIRAAIAPDGAWFIADINGAATFEENLAENRNAPMMYAMSVLSCMSSALSEADGAGLGTLGLPEPAMRELVLAAGFTTFRRVDLPHPV
ncbi:MAG TPA: class I SAM-dependent methyltransferase, partial [Steroidobacteraceae bacterium]|nr:class I SAM-dependent methyltransferase [Steroidobacteraceae bacterium]